MTLRGLAVLALVVSVASPASADEAHHCLDPEQRRAAIAGHQAVPLTKAIRAAKAHVGGDVVNARLCQQGKALVYVLTILARDGKVMRASVDGTSGAFL